MTAKQFFENFNEDYYQYTYILRCRAYQQMYTMNLIPAKSKVLTLEHLALLDWFIVYSDYLLEKKVTKFKIDIPSCIRVNPFLGIVREKTIRSMLNDLAGSGLISKVSGGLWKQNRNTTTFKNIHNQLLATGKILPR